MMLNEEPRVGLVEALGLRPLGLALAQARVALGGEADVPPSRFDTSSLALLRPRIGLPLWLGREAVPRRAVIINLFNHRQTPVDEGWSVRRTSVRDFRGRELTYDSHNGTDFAIPLGTPVLAPAPGRVVRVAREFNRGGLKVFIDHGDGLMTTCAHLARSLVRPGDMVARGERIARSGYSGLDGFSTFPWGVPHVHFNTWLDGEPVDPFPHDDAPSLWRAGRLPEPCSVAELEAGVGGDDAFEPSRYDADRVRELIEGCKTSDVRAELEAEQLLGDRAARAIIELNYYPTRFERRVSPYAEQHERAPRLDLPFPAELFDGVAFADEL